MALTVTIAGVDRTAWIETGIQITRTISGGSKSSATLKMNNKGRSIVRPPMGAAVVIADGADKKFAGIIDNYDELDYTGSSALDVITLNCADYGALCDRRIVGRVISTSEATTVNATIPILLALHSDLGITFVAGTDPGVTLGEQVFNYITLTEALNQVCGAANCDWRVDFDKNLYIFDRNTGYAAAPFTITQDDGHFRNPHVIVDMSRYRNRVGVRNSANVTGMQSTTYTPDGTGDQLPLASQAEGGMWLVNGVEVPGVIVDGTSMPSALPVAAGDSTHPGIMPINMVQLSSPPPLGSTVQANYISPLSQIAWAQDDAEIAPYGPFECVEEARDVDDMTTLQAIASEILDRRKRKPTTFTIESDEDGLEPGMLLSVTLTRPLVSADLLVVSVSSEEQGRNKWWRHQVTATNQPQDINAEVNGIASDLAYLGRISRMRAQPKDRVIDRIGFTVAETIEGFTNPGLTSGVKQAISQVQKPGVIREINLVFNSALANPATLTVLQNGSSIGSITATAGSTIARVYPYSGGPVKVARGDLITYQSDTDEPTAMDGRLELVVVGG